MFFVLCESLSFIGFECVLKAHFSILIIDHRSRQLGHWDQAYAFYYFHITTVHQLWMPHKRITVTGKPSHFPRLTAKILIFIFFTPLANVSWLNARLRCVEMRFWSQTIIFCLLLVFVSMLHNGFKCFLKEHSFHYFLNLCRFKI